MGRGAEVSRIRIKYVHGYLDRHGRSRHYFRRPGIKRIALPGLPGSPEFNAAYETALAGNAVPRMQVGSNRTIPGNVNAVIVGYYSSTEFSNLKEGTRRERRRILEKFRCEHGNKGTAGIQSHHIEAMVAAKLSTPAEALNFLKAIRALLDYAVKAKMRSDNPAKNVTKPKLGGSFYTWSEHDIAKFEKNFPIGTKARLAFGLLLYTAQRRGDVIRMGRQHIRNTQQGAVIYVRQEKTGAELLIQIHPELQKIIDACPPARLTFLANEKKWKADDGGQFRSLVQSMLPSSRTTRTSV